MSSPGSGGDLELFKKQLGQLAEYLSERQLSSATIPYRGKPSWPAGSSRDVILSMDTAVELGSPKVESVSSLIVCEGGQVLGDDTITVIGDDICSAKERLVPFGKIVLVSCVDTVEENLYERYRKLETIRFAVALKGYMIKAASQYKREWSRVSREAVENRFSFEILGSALIAAYRELDYVRSAAVLFVTRSAEDVRGLRPIADGTARIVGAMNKMMEELESDCDECEYQAICDEMPELQSMKKRAHGRAK